MITIIIVSSISFSRSCELFHSDLTEDLPENNPRNILNSNCVNINPPTNPKKLDGISNIPCGIIDVNNNGNGTVENIPPNIATFSAVKNNVGIENSNPPNIANKSTNKLCEYNSMNPSKFESDNKVFLSTNALLKLSCKSFECNNDLLSLPKLFILKVKNPNRNNNTNIIKASLITFWLRL